MYIVQLYGYDIDGNNLYAIVDTLSDYNSQDNGELFTSLDGAEAVASYMNGDDQ